MVTTYKSHYSVAKMNAAWLQYEMESYSVNCVEECYGKIELLETSMLSQCILSSSKHDRSEKYIQSHSLYEQTAGSNTPIYY